MIHPSYKDLMNAINANVEFGDEPVVNSRYSIVLAAAKRARQIINGAPPETDNYKCDKPLSIAVAELYEGKVKILTGNENDEINAITENAEEIEDTVENFDEVEGDFSSNDSADDDLNLAEGVEESFTEE